MLEQGDRPGGAVHSREGPLPGFIEDPCAGYFPLTRASPAFAKIGLERFGVEWIDTPVVMVHPFPDGRAITLHRDLEPTVASLEAVRPGTGRAWADLVEPLLRAERMVRRVALSPLPPVAPALALALRLRRSGIELARLLAGSVATLGQRALGGDEAAAWLAGSTVHSDLAPDTPGGVGLFLHLLGHMVGWPFPRGGAGRITDALVRRLEAAGGTVRCGCAVERIDPSTRSASSAVGGTGSARSRSTSRCPVRCPGAARRPPGRRWCTSVGRSGSRSRRCAAPASAVCRGGPRWWWASTRSRTPRERRPAGTPSTPTRTCPRRARRTRTRPPS